MSENTPEAPPADEKPVDWRTLKGRERRDARLAEREAMRAARRDTTPPQPFEPYVPLEYRAPEDLTDEERAVLARAKKQQKNESDLREKVAQALANNRDFLDKANPTATQSQAQVKALTRQVNGVIRLLTRDFDGVE